MAKKDQKKDEQDMQGQEADQVQKGARPTHPDEAVRGVEGAQEQPEKVQTSSGHVLPTEELPEDEMTKQERDRAGLDPVDNDQDQEEGASGSQDEA